MDFFLYCIKQGNAFIFTGNHTIKSYFTQKLLEKFLPGRATENKMHSFFPVLIPFNLF